MGSLNSGEWLTYNRGARYRPSKQELDYDVKLVTKPDPRPVPCYDLFVMDGDENHYSALVEQSDEESEKVVQKVVVQDNNQTAQTQIAALRVKLQTLETRLTAIEDAYDGGSWGDHAMEADPTEREIAAVKAKLLALGATV